MRRPSSIWRCTRWRFGLVSTLCDAKAKLDLAMHSRALRACIHTVRCGGQARSSDALAGASGLSPRCAMRRPKLDLAMHSPSASGLSPRCAMRRPSSIWRCTRWRFGLVSTLCDAEAKLDLAMHSLALRACIHAVRCGGQARSGDALAGASGLSPRCAMRSGGAESIDVTSFVGHTPHQRWGARSGGLAGQQRRAIRCPAGEHREISRALLQGLDRISGPGCG